MKPLYSPESPASYQLAERRFHCNVCGVTFIDLISTDQLLVKFVEVASGIVRWLPTYEKHGYFDLMERLVPGYSRSHQITMPIVRAFMAEFAKLQEPTPSGNAYQLEDGAFCPNCGSRNLKLEHEQMLNSPPIELLRYSLPDK